MQARVRQTTLKKQFILTVRGPDFTHEFCELNFPDFDIDWVKARTVDENGTKMIFVHHGRQLRVNQWFSAVEEYNKEAPVHLKIHWAGSTDAEHIRVNSFRGSRLTSTAAYRYNLQKDQTYMEWSSPAQSGPSRVDAPGEPSSSAQSGPSRVDAPAEHSRASSKRNSRSVYENMNVDEIYRDMNIDPESPKHKHARPADYATESDDEVLEPVQPRVVPLVDVPAQVIHELRAPAPIINELPPQAIREVQAPVQPRVVPLPGGAALVQQGSWALPGQSGVSPFRAWAGNQVFYFVPAPVVNQIPPLVVNEAPASVIEEVRAPVIEEVQAPVIEEVQAPDIEEVQAPDIEEVQAPDIEEVQAPVINEPPPQVINEPQSQQPVNNPQPHSEQPITGDQVSLAALTAFMQPIFALMQRIVASREE